jgi:hypothetical protein
MACVVPSSQLSAIRLAGRNETIGAIQFLSDPLYWARATTRAKMETRGFGKEADDKLPGGPHLPRIPAMV